MASSPTASGCCSGNGPGYSSPKDAITNGPREKLIYVTCVQTSYEDPDYLATVDVDPDSKTCCQVIHRLQLPNIGDELHHSGWNTCSSCYHDKTKKRNRLILAGLNSDRIYAVDVDDERSPELHKVIETSEVHASGVSMPHTIHCLPSNEIMISTLGDSDGNAKGSFLVLDAGSLAVKGVWPNGGDAAGFGYDFWYQPYFNVLISSEWGEPKTIKKGFTQEDTRDKYGRSLNVWDWTTKRLIQTIDLGEEGAAPLELRFKHDPKSAEGFVGCAVYSHIFRFFRNDAGTWSAQKVISVPMLSVEGWALPQMAGLITDIILSMDDRYLYFSNWLHGDVRQYDISNTKEPKLVGQIFLGGSLIKGGPVKILDGGPAFIQPEPRVIKGVTIQGGPQMLQLSLDGKRLYVTNSLFSPWDRKFYPDMIKYGSTMVQIDVDVDKGGLTVNKDFLVNFGQEPNGPVLAHEMRYPGGDCTSDIFLASEN